MKNRIFKIELIIRNKIINLIESMYNIDFKGFYPPSMVRMQFFHTVKEKHQTLHLFKFLIHNLIFFDRLLTYIVFFLMLKRKIKISDFISKITFYSKRVRIIPVQSGFYPILDPKNKDYGKTLKIEFIIPLEGNMKEGNFGDLKYKGKIIDIEMPVWNNDMENEIIVYTTLAEATKNPLNNLDL